MDEAKTREPAAYPSPFVVGTSRSGTTLLRLMLDAHPELAIPPETHFIPALVSACAGATDPGGRFLQVLISHPRWGDQRVDANTLALRIATLQPFTLADGLRLFYRTYADRFGKRRWGDKTPGYQLHMSLIASLLPEAHFLHLIRDGRDVALSVKDLWFGPDSIEDAARWWVTRIRGARRQAMGLAHYLEVRYEDLVSEPEATLMRICRFIDLPWNPSMLEYHRTAEERLQEIRRPVPGPDGTRFVGGEQRLAMHALTRKPPQAGHVARWRREMSAAEANSFWRMAGDLLEELGYPPA